MNRVLKIILTVLMVIPLSACADSCEHIDRKTIYTEGDLLQIEKKVMCNDCEEELEVSDLKAVEYIYDKEIIKSQGISVVVNKLTVDAWGLMGLELTVTGTDSSKRTFETTSIFANEIDSNGWIYANDLSNNKSSIVTHLFSDTVPVNDFLKSQDYKIEIEYTITNSNNYKTLKESSVVFNLNEFKTINEVKE